MRESTDESRKTIPHTIEYRGQPEFFFTLADPSMIKDLLHGRNLSIDIA